MEKVVDMSEHENYSEGRQREWLLARQKDLLAEVDEARAALAGVSNPRDTEATDFKDLVDRHQQTELQDSEMRRDLDELEVVNEALRRLDEGHYGSCVSCEEAIDFRRLMAYPAAARCMKCQVAFETQRAPR